MQCRGRSRLVSQAALARQASEERRRNHPPPPPPSPPLPPTTDASRDSESIHHSPPPSPTSTSRNPIFDPMSPEDYAPSPTPPTSLEDQVHIAYALDNIHLAKILLLKLKGIEVTSDDDPRIAAVQDEDFDVCFVPAGRLTLDEADEKAVQEAQRRECERWQEQLRAERLRACERIWDQEKRRLRQERLLVIKAREQAVALENERKRREAESVAEHERMRYHQRLMTRSWQRPRSVLSYDSLSQSHLSDVYPSSSHEPFQYQFMTPSSSITRHSRAKEPQPRPPSPLPSPSDSVPFKDVLASMHGPLFPEATPAPALATKHAASASASQCQDPAYSELLESLLRVVEWEESDRREVKGKAPMLERTPSYRSSRRDGEAKCAACSASAMSVTSSPTSNTGPRSAPSRSVSWLSFTSGSSSSSNSSSGSASTAPTTPSTSPISSWLKKTPLSQPSLSKPFHARSEYKPTPLRHSCHSRLTVVSAGPLDLAVPDRTPRVIKEDPSRAQTLPEVLDIGDCKTSCPLVVAVAERMSFFLRLQTTSISATFLATISDTFREQERDHSLTLQEGRGDATRTRKLNWVDTQKPSAPAPPATGLNKLKLKPPGYRVCAADASMFILPVSDDDPHQPSSASVHFIPLLAPHDHDHDHITPSSSSTVPCTRTALPHPPSLVFPPPPPLTRSPLRPREPPPEGEVLLRMRPVANPALLRLKALQNVLWERGVGWEGRGREGGLGAGRERLCRIGFDGLGRSALACEVRQQQQQQQPKWVM